MTHPTPTREAQAREVLGRFGYHPDPAIDFCCEVEAIEGEAYDVSVGAHDRAKLLERIDKAMMFRVGGDVGAIDAKHALRQVEAALKAGTEAAYMRELIAKRSRPAPKDQPRPIETGEVIQADREAAAQYWRSVGYDYFGVTAQSGEQDGETLVQAFKNYRLAFASPLHGEREALTLARPIVEADLEQAKEYSDSDWIGMSQTALDAIDAILAPPVSSKTGEKA